MIYENDPDLIFKPNGAAEALAEAKRQGIHLRMLQHGFPFDTVQMPLNRMDAEFRSFERRVLPEANRQGLGVFGMKSLRDRCRVYSADGRFELYKTTVKYDGKPGREQRHYPSEEELPV